MEGSQVSDSSQGKLKNFNMSAKCLFKRYSKINQEEKKIMLEQKCSNKIIDLSFTEQIKEFYYLSWTFSNDND